uniref:Uncharacterized protein n=1 Tax=Neogobius melanostomus TaxID=47308 RepID=A0A8C6V1G3_9GOBI
EIEPFSFSEDLTCAICLSVFTEPVMLPCGHWFCRHCISESLNGQPLCPICREYVPAREALPLCTRPLRIPLRVVGPQEGGPTSSLRAVPAKFLCPDHDEKLKLYCITDQQLACVICRDSQKHESHKFKPVNEAAALVRAHLQNLVQKLSADSEALERLVQSQREEVDSTKRQSGELKSLISSKFEEMYRFLRKRAQELTGKVNSDEEAGLNKMTEKLRDMEAAITENRKLEETVTSALQIQDNERFLKMWSMEEEAMAVMCSSMPKGGDLQVQKTELSLGPYESHLQLFVWKEMLQVVTPREERLLLKNDQTSLMVSQDQGSATFCHYHNKQNKQTYGHLDSPSTRSANALAGKHYWEVYVGQHSDWHLGIAKCYLKHTSGTYKVYTLGCASAAPAVQGKPPKIGIYLNCPRKELSFYDADNMVHIHTASLANVSFPVSPFFKLGNSCHDPLIVCRY